VGALGPSGTLDDRITGVGAAWLLPESWDAHVIQHTGATVGQFSSLTVVPAGGFAVAVLTNTDSGMPLHREITPGPCSITLASSGPIPWR